MKQHVKDVMTSEVVVAGESSTFKEIAGLMSRYGISALPVVDANRVLVGVVSEADLLPKKGDPGAAQERDRWFEPKKRKVERHKATAKVARELMTTPVVSIHPDESVREAARLMYERGVKRLPVVGKDGRVVGIISRRDVLKTFLRTDAEIRQEIEHDILVRTLWMETESIRVSVRSGIVTLRGRVERKSLIDLIVGLARRLDGVVDVVTELTFSEDDTKIRPESAHAYGVLPSAARWP